MAKPKDDYLTKEATRIGLQKMLADLDQLLQTDLSIPQRVALTDQRAKLQELLEAL